MNVSQNISHVNENAFDDEITITDIPQGYFPAVTANNLPAGATTREVEVMIMPLEQSPGNSMNVNTGLYVKGPDETAVCVKVTQDGKEVVSNTTNY